MPSGKVTKVVSMPAPKVYGIIQKSFLWKNTVELLGAGHEVSVTIPNNFLAAEGITSKRAINSFKRSLQRYIDRELSGRFCTYVVGGVIYASKVKK